MCFHNFVITLNSPSPNKQPLTTKVVAPRGGGNISLMMTAAPVIMTNPFQERYYIINKTLLNLIGGWPYTRQPVRYSVLFLVLFFMTAGLIPQMFATLEILNEWDIFVETMLSWVINIACYIKLATVIVNIKKIHKILEHIRIDWISLAGQPELHILHEFAERGRLFTIAYGAGLYGATLFHMYHPVMMKTLQVLNLRNDSEPAPFPVLVKSRYLDIDAHYFSMLPVFATALSVILIILFAVDTLFIVQVQHGCAMFSVLGHQLQRVTNEVTDDLAMCSRPVEDPAFRHLTTCIRNHIKVIEFSDLLDSVYSPGFLALVVLNMILIGITAFQATLLVKEKPLEALLLMLSIGGEIGHLFFLCYFSQKLMDHSQRVREFLCEAEWYRTTLYAQKLFIFISMRTLAPCQLSAGKFFVMSLESFTMAIKTSVSYFTLLLSMH